MIYTLPKKWNWKTLGDIADIIGGVSYNPNDITSSGVRIIRGGNIQNGDVRKKEDDVFLPISYANEENQIHQYDTIIVSSTGSVEALAKAATCFDEMPNTQIGAFLRIIRPKEPKYAMLVSMWCTSQHFRDYLINQAKGTSINNIRTDFLTNFKILVPSDTDIQNLSNLYLNVSQKIALNRTINQQLEQLARTIYNYYFLQFHTPLTPLHDTPSCPQHPNTPLTNTPTLTYNPILKKNIPIGWEVKTLGEVLGRVQSTVKLKTNEYNKDGKYPIIDQSSDTYIAGYTDRQDAVVNKYPVVVFGDHSCSVKYVNFPFCRGADGTQIIFSNDERLFAEYLYFVVKSIKISEGYARHFSLLKSTPIIVPDIKTASLYHKIVTPLFEKIRDNNKEITTLTTYRDALLPLLMNGQVEVKV